MENACRPPGRVEKAHETVPFANTRDDPVAATTAMIRSKHSYTLSCVVSIFVPKGGNPNYLAWLRAQAA
jgi:uncharacterized protein involved in tolerance to divalent cations